jgi:hypothetical protein
VPHMNIIGCMSHCHSQVRSCPGANEGASRTSARLLRRGVVLCMCIPLALVQSWTWRSRSALAMTDAELNVIAALPMIGLSSRPVHG